MRPIVIVAAVNGGYQLSDALTHVPITPAEIGDEAARCREAGAAVIHTHARDEEGLTTADPEVFQAIIRAIRAQSDILIQTTNGIGSRKDKVTGEWVRPTDADRLALLNLTPRPDLYGAATGSTDFVHAWGGQPVEKPFVNNRDWLMRSIRHAHSEGSAIEFEVVHIPALYRLKQMADEGLFDASADYLWLTHGGGIANAPAVARVMMQSIEEGRVLFPKAKVGIFGCGPHQFPVAALGLAADCDVLRVGMEDNRLLPNGEPAASNHQIVAKTVELAKFFNRVPATPAQAREILGLQRATNVVIKEALSA
jgi:3-keto-5-aminohexanoate cleavage enzyme